MDTPNIKHAKEKRSPPPAERAISPVRVMAPAPDFLPPLEGESAMLLHLLGRAFADLLDGV